MPSDPRRITDHWSDAAKKCQEQRCDISYLGLSWSGELITTLRNPLLIVHQLIGIIICLAALLTLATRTAPTNRFARTAKSRRTIVHWAAACVWYIGMSVSSIFAHSVFEPNTPSWQIYWSIDSLCTGLCAMNLFIGSFSGKMMIPSLPPPARSKSCPFLTNLCATNPFIGPFLGNIILAVALSSPD